MDLKASITTWVSWKLSHQTTSTWQQSLFSIIVCYTCTVIHIDPYSYPPEFESLLAHAWLWSLLPHRSTSPYLFFNESPDPLWIPLFYYEPSSCDQIKRKVTILRVWMHECAVFLADPGNQFHIIPKVKVILYTISKHSGIDLPITQFLCSVWLAYVTSEHDSRVC